MRAHIGLTTLQFFLVSAAPRHRKQVSDPIPSNYPTEFFPQGIIYENPNGDLYVSEDCLPLGTISSYIQGTGTKLSPTLSSYEHETSIAHPSTLSSHVEETSATQSSTLSSYVEELSTTQSSVLTSYVGEISTKTLVTSRSSSASKSALESTATSGTFTYTVITADTTYTTTSGTTLLVSTRTFSTQTNALFRTNSTAGIFFASISTSTVTPSVSVTTISTSSGVAQILPSLTTAQPDTLGTVITSLGTTVASSSGALLITSISSPSTIISITAPATSISSSIPPAIISSDIFQPVATDAPPAVISTRGDHPVPRLGIQPQDSPIGTNKFYGNFFLGSQTAATWTHPYSVAWSKGSGSSSSWGMSIQHIEESQRVFGPNPSANPVEYFINPIGIQSLILSAAELGSSTELSLDSVGAFSVNVNLLPSAGAKPAIIFPLVQGMGFITAIFDGSATPVLQTGIFFRSITKVALDPKPNVTKYTILLEDGTTWLLYAHSPEGPELDIMVVNNSLAKGTSTFNGIIQIAKNPGSAESIYDAACGAFVTTATLSGSVDGGTGNYTLSFVNAGITNTSLLMFALPHHVESFSLATRSALTSLQLSTTTKGLATAVIADSWTLTENIPVSMGFAPWSPSLPNKQALSSAAISVIQSVAAGEVSQNMSQQTNLDSMYYSGKALAKFAGIVHTIHDLLSNDDLAQAGLSNLKASFAVFANNMQTFPLVHETAWGGIVSSASYVTGNSGDDFGNTYYNDHHFHYGYFIYTAAVIGYLEPSWIEGNKDYVNSLVRDIANPSTADNYFPISRNFDWYHGHSWAHGLYEAFDGKDEESSSEDSMSAYAIKMWGRTIGDNNMEARGNLQLAVTARSLQNYFLYESDNTVQPANFIGNKVSGILFENKVDHTTYFGTNIEYIQGIHMLPLLPSSTLTRTPQFVTEEWDMYFSDGRVDSIIGGWKGVLYANLALIDARTSWSFFSQPNFDVSWLDGGASLTWYLALAAGLGGSP